MIVRLNGFRSNSLLCLDEKLSYIGTRYTDEIMDEDESVQAEFNMNDLISVYQQYQLFDMMITK